MDIFTIKQWIFILTVVNIGWWVYAIKKAKDAFEVLKKDNETLYTELKKATRDLPL